MLQQIQQSYNQISTREWLESRYQSYCGKNGSVTFGFKSLKGLSPEEKQVQWPLLKEAKDLVEKLYQQAESEYKRAEINAQLLNDPIDISLDTVSDRGHWHLLAQERRHVEEVAARMGMHVEYGHDVVTKYQNFYSVNIPADHPAVEMHDTIYLDRKDEFGEYLVMRTHTSAHQVDYIRRHGTPLELISVGRVYRYEKLDASHDSAFWQVEGMVIDRHVTVEHFISFMTEFLSALFGEEKKIRLRPAYFPFVEPGFEIDVNYNIGTKEGDDNRLELLGAGMIHPNVLQEAGLDPNEYSGFAFGIGLTRLVAVKHNIRDVRLFTNGDMRFVKSF